MKYRNKSDHDLAIVGYGIVQAGHVVELPFELNNQNFEKIEDKKEEDKKK